MDSYVTQILTDYVGRFIDEKYTSLKVKYNDMYHLGEGINSLFKPVHAEFSPYVLSDLLNSIPDASITEITSMIDNLSSLNKGNVSYASYTFIDTDTSIGLGDLTIHFKYSDVHCCCCAVEYRLEMTIPNVIWTNYKFYYVTKEFENWLNVADKPKRKTALSQLITN